VRGSASRAHGIKGTGIGLAMVRHIVEAHGGTVRVESALGEGSKFTILLPAQSPDVAVGLQPSQAVKEGDKPRWLAS
jgi:signal transduction histidine kinase